MFLWWFWCYIPWKTPIYPCSPSCIRPRSLEWPIWTPLLHSLYLFDPHDVSLSLSSSLEYNFILAVWLHWWFVQELLCLVFKYGHGVLYRMFCWYHSWYSEWSPIISCYYNECSYYVKRAWLWCNCKCLTIELVPKDSVVLITF